MKIWLINHYAVPPQYYPLARPSVFAKNLIKMGHEVTIIAASTVHNSDLDMINDGSRVKREIIDGIPYVFIKCRHYKGNGIDRVINILEFAIKLPRICNSLDKPDAIVATSFDPLSCYQGVRYAKKHGIKVVAEIADLWPETLVSYGAAKPSNPIVKILRQIEKRIYIKSDAIVFTMAGAYDYILEQGWETSIPRSKVYYINNGIDLSEFDFNKRKYVIDDEDLRNPDIYKVIYAGSIRRVNHLGTLLDAAKLINDSRIRLLIWGSGDELAQLKDRVVSEHIGNVVFKGILEKKYIPYITSCADLNIAHGDNSPILRFGLSPNNLFDYLAAGRPVLVDFHSPYNPILDCNAGFESDGSSANDIANAIERACNMSEDEERTYCDAARLGAEQFDFKVLTQKLLDVIESV